MRVIIKKVGEEYVLYVKTDAMGDQPAGNRLYKANHPQQPFPDKMRYDDPNEAMKGAEYLQVYLDKDSVRRIKKKGKRT